ncbi:hypothetical protein I7I51_02535 [Histoplasma capsulatum]|uniref:Uncharacterized protein n=1 Tax=Ajellomyces capsulatus TaxID=5037 RepID=A0A8A1MAI4_AJECA|nr:hypothetical protein I7I51_02535 [Histoplasma capsulatum]
MNQLSSGIKPAWQAASSRQFRVSKGGRSLGKVGPKTAGLLSDPYERCSTVVWDPTSNQLGKSQYCATVKPRGWRVKIDKRKEGQEFTNKIRLRRRLTWVF